MAGDVSADRSDVLAMESVDLVGICMEGNRSGVGPAAASKVNGTLSEGAPPPNDQSAASESANASVGAPSPVLR